MDIRKRFINQCILAIDTAQVKLDRDDTRAFIAKELRRVHCFTTYNDIVNAAVGISESANNMGVELDRVLVLRLLNAERHFQHTAFT